MQYSERYDMFLGMDAIIAKLFIQTFFQKKKTQNMGFSELKKLIHISTFFINFCLISVWVRFTIYMSIKPQFILHISTPPFSKASDQVSIAFKT